jgi:hypothetical protein
VVYDFRVGVVAEAIFNAVTRGECASNARVRGMPSAVFLYAELAARHLCPWRGCANRDRRTKGDCARMGPYGTNVEP